MRGWSAIIPTVSTPSGMDRARAWATMAEAAPIPRARTSVATPWMPAVAPLAYRRAAATSSPSFWAMSGRRRSPRFGWWTSTSIDRASSSRSRSSVQNGRIRESSSGPTSTTGNGLAGSGTVDGGATRTLSGNSEGRKPKRRRPESMCDGAGRGVRNVGRRARWK